MTRAILALRAELGTLLTKHVHEIIKLHVISGFLARQPVIYLPPANYT